MAFRIRKPSQESFFALNAIPLYSYAIPLVLTGRGARWGSPCGVQCPRPNSAALLCASRAALSVMAGLVPAITRLRFRPI